MRRTEGARLAAPALLAAVAGTTSAGLAVLATAGVHLCHHVGHGAAEGGLCPAVVYAAAVAAALCLFSVITLAGARAGAHVALESAARRIARCRLGPLTAGLALLGAVPLAVMAGGEGLPAGPEALTSVVVLAAGAFVGALALLAAARLVLRFAARLVVALREAFRYLEPGADTPWLAPPRLVPIARGVHVARRTPSRAPPLR